MKNKEKEALKKAFGIPEPVEADAFFERPEFAEVKEKRRRALLFHRIPAALRYGTIAVAAAAVIGVWGGFRNWAETDKFDKNNQSDVTEVTSPPEQSTGRNDNTIIVTTGSDTAVVDIVTTKAELEDDVTVTTTVPPDIDSGDDNTVVTEVKRTTAVKTETGRTSAATVRPPSNRTTTTTGRTPSKSTTTAAGNHSSRTTATTAGSPTIQTTTKEPSKPVTTTGMGTHPSPVLTTSKASEPQVDYPDPVMPTGGRDLTVRPDVVYNVSGNVVDVHELNGSGNAALPKDNEDPPTDGAVQVIPVNSLVRMSDQVLIGVVEEIIYTSENGYPITQTNIRVSESLYGDIRNGDMISIRSSGGFIPVKDYAPAKENGYPYEYRNYYAVDYSGSMYRPETGEESVFFLNNDGDCFSLCTYDAESVYCDYDGSGRYRCWANGSFSTTYAKITDAIYKFK